MSVAGLIGGAQDPRETRSALENVGVGTAGTPGDLEDLIVAIAKMAEGKPPQVAFAERDGILPTSTDIAKATGVKENPLYQMFALDPTGGLGKVAKGAKFMDDIIGAMVLAHGTPHMWKGNKADISKIGTGEGAQAYGHGLYFAEDPKVAGTYKQSKEGNLYEVDIPDEEIARMLDWDAPLSQQPESVRQALESSGFKGETYDVVDDTGAVLEEGFNTPSEAELFINAEVGVPAKVVGRSADLSGEDIYRALSDQFGYEKAAASEHLNTLGIPGIRYLDGTSRRAGEGTRNVVKFGDDNITTLTRNGEPVTDGLVDALADVTDINQFKAEREGDEILDAILGQQSANTEKFSNPFDKFNELSDDEVRKMAEVWEIDTNQPRDMLQVELAQYGPRIFSPENLPR